ncbi:cysteine synthase family protein [Cryobacterium glaciale]|uniref:Cysteine synthase family protein n=1 Tax=Cryobacterium glaciale TaxID=1259145 RepID=A0A4R8UW57_9MICO|nr:cysteine synthase family protein [Cryobacterium glaciale]TFB73253.1 cysteine synthase family protein [Cryobacterium glaciale]
MTRIRDLAAEPLREDVLASVADLVGNTPLVALSVLAAGLPARVLVKLEGRNPGGSAKDRVAFNIIRQAEASGALAPGATIVESSSGNTGIGLALVGRLTGHPVVIVHTDQISAEKLALLTAYGATLVEADGTARPDSPRNTRAVSERIASEIPGAWQSQQFENDDNPGAHYASTGPEIWRQSAHRVTHFVAAIGTGGTVSGAGRFLKEASDGRVRVIGANPAGSTYDGGAEAEILVDGVGSRWPRDWWPHNFHRSVLDDVITIDNYTVYATVRALAREEALLLGPSSGLAVAVALQVARTAAPGSVIVVISPDAGTNYLTKAFDQAWLASQGLLTPTISAPTPKDPS